MKQVDAAAVLAAMEVLHARLDGDPVRYAGLVAQHGGEQLVDGLSLLLETLGCEGFGGDAQAFRGMLHRLALEMQLVGVGGDL